MGATRKNGGHQKGAPNHAEGQHGRKTTAKIAEMWNNPPRNDADTPTGPRYDETEIQAHASGDGRHRIFEGREQHDEADLNSEKTRLARDEERHGHVADGELAERSVRNSAKRKS